MTKQLILFCVLLTFSSVGFVSAQEGIFAESILSIKPFEIQKLPVNVSSCNSVSILPRGMGIFNMGYTHCRGYEFLPDFRQWQKNYIDKNNLRNILSNPTLIDGGVMGYAMRHKSQANMELYRSYMIMNQKMSGANQWDRVGMAAKNIRYLDVVGLSTVGVQYMIYYINDPEFFEKRDYPFRK